MRKIHSLRVVDFIYIYVYINIYRYTVYIWSVLDFDECDHEEDNACHERAQCLNSIGSYSCMCDEGFQGE